MRGCPALTCGIRSLEQAFRSLFLFYERVCSGDGGNLSWRHLAACCLGTRSSLHSSSRGR